MFGLDDQSIPHWQALGSGKKKHKYLQKLLKKFGKKRSRAHSSDSDSSESSEDELDGEAVEKHEARSISFTNFTDGAG